MDMNILIVSAVFPPEPIVSAKLSYDITEYLINGNYLVEVLHPNATRPLGFKFTLVQKDICHFNEITLDSYTCPKSSLLGRFYESYSFGKHCYRYIKKNKDKIAVIYMNSWPLFILKAANESGIKCITHIQDIYPEAYSGKLPYLLGKIIYTFLFPLDRYILSKSSHIFVISSNMKTHLATTRKITPNKFTIVENWQDENVFIDYHKERNNILSDKLSFMYLGNNGPVAGVEFLITCFAQAALPNSRLIIAGRGSKKETCMKLAKNYSEVEILFWDVPNGKVPEIQDQADFMLLPVKKGAAMSSIPSKLPAYMFSKKPIIASLDVNSDTARAILEADCGIVVEPENRKQFVNALREVSYWTPEQIQKKGKNGFEYAMHRFSKRHNLPLITNVITQSCIR